ncbi:unnamed protein product [Candidula unifasciata]|uniref:Cytochrome P450 n=1 Tax=Candidula unifasciata TaxID=100452 RepID=A0A8S3YII4_9EUPU|nr:unnamed protein product [Candidula unifasciata]
MDLLLVLVTLVLVLLIYFGLQRHDPRLPPCPSRPLPIIGHLLVLQPDSRAQFTKWRQEFGDLFSFYMGRQLNVVVSGHANIKELLLKKGDDCLDRPQMFFDEKGVIMSAGPEWKEQRAVMLSILKDIGMGKNLLAEKIQEEIQNYTEVLAGLGGQPTNLRVITNLSTSNIVCSVAVGFRFEYDDADFREMMTTLDHIVEDLSISNMITYFPLLKYIPGDIFRANRIQSSIKKVMNLIINKFLQSGGESPDTLISAYMKECQRRRQAGETTTMSEDNLAKIIWDLFNAGTETAATTILWCILYSLNYPGAQQKIYDEIEREVGSERLPSMHDKNKLVYLNAFIMESQRLSSITALSLPRMCTSDISIAGYTLPKGAAVHANLDSISYDEKIWGDNVNVLVPERFIDENGKLKVPEEFIPFGIGKRACPGESWAKTLLFLYLAAMFQRFKFLSPTDGSPPPTDYVFGIDVCPVPYEVRVIDRRAEK